MENVIMGNDFSDIIDFNETIKDMLKVRDMTQHEIESLVPKDKYDEVRLALFSLVFSNQIKEIQGTFSIINYSKIDLTIIEAIKSLSPNPASHHDIFEIVGYETPSLIRKRIDELESTGLIINVGQCRFLVV